MISSRQVVLALLAITIAACGDVDRGLARGARRSVARAVAAKLARIFSSDLERDARVVAQKLESPRTVTRYTSSAQARLEAHGGIDAGRHMTSVGGPGRPLSGKSAQERYGLRERPTVRETIMLPAEQPVKKAKVIGGAPGLGEITSPHKVPPQSVRRIVQVP